ncbi:hypothetical protein ABIC75_000201 [Dyella japonica]|uniref:Uncharacterized protein n=1 Tax=Dyella japonica TaxID=231455 RepID=A0ABV2JNS9_9GAMM
MRVGVSRPEKPNPSFICRQSYRLPGQSPSIISELDF